MDQYYLRARYYNQNTGRFTQQDTYLGNNYDPVSLHKYLYANVDPGNMIDPSGNFSMGGLMSAVNIMATLASTASTTYDVFQIATGEKEFSAREFATSILLSKLPIKFVKSFLKKACSINSFDGDTLVSTESGFIPLSRIEIGDYVWAHSEETDEVSLKEVIHLIHGEGLKNIVDITLSNDEVLTATAEHPFFVPALDAWVDSIDLVVGQELVNQNEGLVQIKRLNPYQKTMKVYNLTVDGDHTYFVGKSGVLSHNANGCKPIGKINMRHIMSGDKYGGGHSIRGLGINVISSGKKLPNGVYKAKIKNPVTGKVETKTFYPDGWDERQIQNAIMTAHTKNLSKGGKSLQFDEWVKINGKQVQIRVEMKEIGDKLEVLTAHPLFGVHP